MSEWKFESKPEPEPDSDQQRKSKQFVPSSFFWNNTKIKASGCATVVADRARKSGIFLLSMSMNSE